jgi:hypothetical protein
MAGLDLQIRTGIHTGACELEGSRPVGMAVAEPGGILAVVVTGFDRSLDDDASFVQLRSRRAAA